MLAVFSLVTAKILPSCALLLACILLPGCTYEDQGGPLPLRPSSLRILRSDPGSGAVGVELERPLKVFFNVAPDPLALDRTSLRLFSGAIEITGVAGAVDLLQRSVSFRPSPRLRPELQYRLFVSGGLRAIDGSALKSSIGISFTTGIAAGNGPSAPQPTAEAIQPLWQAKCASCHAPPNPALGVDLSSAEAARRTMRGVRSSDERLLIVNPRAHAKSYLMRKLLGSAGILGFLMPPDEPPLTAAELRQVADWIDGGAQ